MLAVMELEAASSFEREGGTTPRTAGRPPSTSSVPTNPKSLSALQLQKSDSPTSGSPGEGQHSAPSNSNHPPSLPDLPQAYSNEDMEKWKDEEPVFSFDGPMPKWMEEALVKMGHAGKAYAWRIKQTANDTKLISEQDGGEDEG